MISTYLDQISTFEHTQKVIQQKQIQQMETVKSDSRDLLDILNKN